MSGGFDRRFAAESDDLRLAYGARVKPVPPILTIPRVAKLLGLNRESVRRLIRTGAIPARKLDGIRQRYIVYDELLAAMKPTRAGQGPL